MTAHAPAFVQPAAGDPSQTFTAQELRQSLIAGLIAAQDGIDTGKAGVAGVTPPSGGAMTGGFAVTQRAAGANFTVDVAAGRAFVNGSDITGQGTYAVWNDGAVSVTVPNPAASVRTHRLILQIQDKLSLGSWSGYTAALVLLPDTGTGTPAPGNSAITLALITVNPGDPSVTNASITDYRRAPGAISVVKTGDTSRGVASMTDDPDLQLWGLRNSAWYAFLGELRLSGNVNYQFQGKWRLNGSAAHAYFTRIGANAGGANITEWGFTDNEVFQCDTGTGSTITQQTIIGAIQTGGTAPNNLAAIQWGQNAANALNPTVLKAGSFLYAWPIL